MLTSIEDPIIEACKFKLRCSPRETQEFIRQFLDSPEGEPFTQNLDGPPGICIFDPAKPMDGLQTFGFEGAQQLQNLFAQVSRSTYESEQTYAANTVFDEGDLLVFQARKNLPHSGGSTILGKLRIALYKAALAEKLVQPDVAHHYLWVTDFPMFTLDNGIDPGQGGSAGFSATHHPFTAPKTTEDINLLLTDPLKAKADHYDLVVNGVELGGGSRRIHNCEMQKFVMKDILKACISIVQI
jgi:aspartyl-tRNA synthetase